MYQARPGSDPFAEISRPVGELQPGLLESLLEEIDTGLLVCDARGRLLFANGTARHSLDACSPLALVDGHLHATGDPRLVAKLASALRTRRRQLLHFRQLGAPMIALALPLACGLDGSERIALMFGRHRQQRLAIEMLAGLFGLTLTERDVLHRLAEGKRVASIARERGVALCTVRSQIQALRQKTETESIRDVLALVANLPPMTSALRARGVTHRIPNDAQPVS